MYPYEGAEAGAGGGAPGSQVIAFYKLMRNAQAYEA